MTTPETPPPMTDERLTYLRTKASNPLIAELLTEVERLRPLASLGEATEDELAIINGLAAVWNAYCRLPKEHPMESGEFCTAIHVCQNIVGSRATWRLLRTDATQETTS